MSRREFSPDTKRKAHTRSRGICECHRLAGLVPGFLADGCGRPLGQGNTFYEHINPNALSGMNDLSNCAVLTKTCWRIKTDRYDIPTIAKSNRVRDRARNIRAMCARPLIGTRRSGVKLPMGGGAYWRDSGRPVGRPR